MISMFHSFFKVYRSREGPSHIWSHKKTERQWYGTTYKQTGICKTKVLLMQCWILCEIKTCIRLCNLDKVLLFLLLLTMILNCELVVLRYLKVYRLKYFLVFRCIPVGLLLLKWEEEVDVQIIFSEDLLSHGKGLMGEFKFINMTFSARRLNDVSDHGY